MTDFFICAIKSPQCTDMYSKEKFSIAIFLPCVLMLAKRVKFHFRWGTKPRDKKEDTGNDCDVISVLQALQKTDFSDIFFIVS